MITLIVTRLISLLPVAAGIVIVTFLALRLVPGDVVYVILNEYYDPKVAAQLRTLFGLDLPIHVQFGQWVGGLLQGDLGDSLRTGRPVFDEIISRFPATLELALGAMLLSLAIAIPAGVISATRRNTPYDFGARIASLVGLSIPNFFLGILLILVFAVTLRWLPSGGYVPAETDLGEHLRRLVLPVVTLGTSMAAITMRMTRSAMLEVLRQDYVRTARAKGLLEKDVTVRHALRNALVPVVTVVGIQLGSLLGGTVVVERIFSWPGLGTLIVDAILQRDYPLVQAGVMFLALFFVMANLIVDLLYLFLNPRLRSG
jgi:peptide/nickel transport system permease protein